MRIEVAALALALCSFGCGDDETGPGRAHASGHGHSTGGHGTGHPGEEVEVHGTAPDQPLARVARFEGDVVRQRGAIEAGVGLDADDGLTVRGEGRADVDLGDGGRVTLDRDTEIRIGGGPAQVFLVRGALHGVVPAGPARPRPPLRVATPAASVDLGGSGEFFVVAHSSGATWIAGLAGLTTVTSGEADSRHRLRTVELPPGRALLVGARMAEPTEGPTRLADGRAAATLVLETAAPLDATRAASELLDASRRLDESLSWLETEARRGRELTTQHREAVRAGNPPEAMRLQRELVGHSSQLYSLRQVSTARWERLVAGELQLARLPGATSSELVEQRRDRVESLLGS
jgi:hypothetical protein